MKSATHGRATELTTAEIAVSQFDGPQLTIFFPLSLLKDRCRIKKLNCPGLKTVVRVIHPVLEAEYGLSAEESMAVLKRGVPNFIEAGLMERIGDFYRLKPLRPEFAKEMGRLISGKVPRDVQQDIERLLPKIKESFSKVCQAAQ